MKRKDMDEKQRRRNKIARDVATKKYRQRIIPKRKTQIPPEMDDEDYDY